jgi:hypothetical protein
MVECGIMTHYYLVTIRVSDGNDCTVYEAVTEAETEEQAEEQARQSIASDNDGEWDGCDPDGYEVEVEQAEAEDAEDSETLYVTTWIDGIEEYATGAEAEAARSPYHCHWSI